MVDDTEVRLELKNTSVGGVIKAQLENGAWHVELDQGGGLVRDASHEYREAAILICLCAACGFDADLSCHAEK